MKKHQLLDRIDWPRVLSQPRDSGGHEEVMRNIFMAPARVIAFHCEEDYQGEVAVAYLFADGSVAVLTDWFGSCDACDAWEDARGDDNKARELVRSLVGSARLFDSLEDALHFCKHESKDPDHYSHRAASRLTGQIKELAGGRPDYDY